MNLYIPTAIFSTGLGISLYAWQDDDHGERKFLSGAAVMLSSFVAAGILELYRQVPFDLGSGESIWLYRYARKISLTKCPHLTNTHLDPLKNFPVLKELTIEGAPKITSEGLLVLKNCPRIQWLLIQDCLQIGGLGNKAIPSSVIDHLAKQYITSKTLRNVTVAAVHHGACVYHFSRWIP